MNNPICNGNTLTYYIETNEKVHTVPDAVTVIGDYAFSHAVWVEKVLYKSLEKIGAYAFSDCESLSSLLCDGTASEAISECYIAEKAFCNCESLTAVELPPAEKIVIAKEAFKNCTALRTVLCNATTAWICDNPFEDCPEYLTFVCKKDSEIERFAVEHGYKVIYE